MGKSPGNLRELRAATLPGILAPLIETRLPANAVGIFPSETPKFLRGDVYACRQWKAFAHFVSQATLPPGVIRNITRLMEYSVIMDEIAFDLPAAIGSLEMDTARVRKFCQMTAPGRSRVKNIVLLRNLIEAGRAATRDLERKVKLAERLDKSLRRITPNAPGYHPYFVDLLYLVLPIGAKTRLSKTKVKSIIGAMT